MSQVLLIVKVDDNLVHYDERDAEIFNAIESLKFVKDITVYKPEGKLDDPNNDSSNVPYGFMDYSVQNRS
tara:strand:+ start:2301 stop:2510 length:210 start_codon:yes stop_codon:yes gene_type:complete